MSLVYAESSIFSLLARKPSGNVLVASMQKDTHDWWYNDAPKHKVVVSDVVKREIAKGDKDSAAERMKYIQGLDTIEVNPEVEALALKYRSELGLPRRASIDVLHMALAVVHKVDYLLTWNCAHIASPWYIQKLVRLNDKLGRKTPVFLTPRQYFEMVKGE